MQTDYVSVSPDYAEATRNGYSQPSVRNSRKTNIDPNFKKAISKWIKKPEVK